MYNLWAMRPCAYGALNHFDIPQRVEAETAAAAAAARPATDFRLGATVGVSGALLVAVAHRRQVAEASTGVGNS